MNLNACDMCNKFQSFEKQKQDLGSLNSRLPRSKELKKLIHLQTLVFRKKLILAYFSFSPQNMFVILLLKKQRNKIDLV